MSLACRLAAGCLLASSLLFARSSRSLAKRVEKIIAANPVARQARWGILVKELDGGKTVLAVNSGQLFIPASNTKLFTTALALNHLGASYRFRTRVLTASIPGEGGVVGTLTLVGGGDPNLSSRILPYREQDGFGPDPLSAIEDLADQVVAHGVRHVTGAIAGDDTRYEWEPFPHGWSVDDAVEEYGAAVGALVLNDSTFKLTLQAGPAAGDPVTAEFSPSVDELVVHNMVRTSNGAPGVEYRRLPLGNELLLTGSLRPGTTWSETLAASDPAKFAALAFRQALIARGVRVDGGVEVRHRGPGEPWSAPEGVELAVRESAPLSQILEVADKASQNLHTEMVLREVAHARKGSGSRADGLAEMREFLAGIEIADGAYDFADASGLSRLNLVSPGAVVQLLSTTYQSPFSEAWISMLPVGGVDGTLADRFDGDPRASQVHAKTGSMRHVSALSGYVLPSRGKKYVFAILVNGYQGPVEDIRGTIDKIVLALCRSSNIAARDAEPDSRSSSAEIRRRSFARTAATRTSRNSCRRLRPTRGQAPLRLRCPAAAPPACAHTPASAAATKGAPLRHVDGRQT
jgi:serine-type D-Ala-D-Ala carboxypeptidase/endopeptidase (penicillin-binding protein 4)